MEKPFLPWWLIVLIAMWAAALTVWSWKQAHREVRSWAGLAALIYSFFILFALGANPRGVASETGSYPQNPWGLWICFGSILVAAVWLVGAGKRVSRQVAYVGLTLSNAVGCAWLGVPEFSACLVMSLLISFATRRADFDRIFVPGFLRDVVDQFAANRPSTLTPGVVDEALLRGASLAVVGCLLLGTLAYSLRIETSRVMPSPRYTALPTRIQLEKLQTASTPPDKSGSVTGELIGRRADLMILAAIMAFLVLARARSEISEQHHRHTDDRSHPEALPGDIVHDV